MPRNPLPNNPADRDHHQGNSKMFCYFGYGANLPVSRENTCENRQKRQTPRHSHGHRQVAWNQNHDEYEAEADHQSRCKVRDCSDKCIFPLKTLGFLVHMNAEGVGQVVGYGSDQQRADHTGSACICRLQPGNQSHTGNNGGSASEANPAWSNHPLTVIG
jgi:hypothetical protein